MIHYISNQDLRYSVSLVIKFRQVTIFSKLKLFRSQTLLTDSLLDYEISGNCKRVAVRFDSQFPPSYTQPIGKDLKVQPNFISSNLRGYFKVLQYYL